MPKQDANNIFKKYRLGIATDQEKVTLEQWVNQASATEFDLNELSLLNDLLAVRQRVSKSIMQKKVVALWSRLSIAASVVIVVIGGALYQSHHYSKQRQIAFEKITPGGVKATLTLANGQKLILSGTVQGILVKQGNATISMNGQGQLLYIADKAPKPDNGEITYNTLTVPFGGQCQVLLPDGTHVWVNAGSVLRYPSVFAANERRVELTGEAYFKVKHNAQAPFRIVSRGQIVEDMGTTFNIEAYADDKAIATTLVEGRASVTESGKLYMLIPGQQALVSGENVTIKNDQDIESVIAWKNGLFKFDGTLEQIMQQLARWYNVSVTYDTGANRDRIFSGEISRSRNILSIIEIMESTGKVHFKIDGRRITVMP